MKDSEYIEMMRLLDSLIKSADTLRVVFETKAVEDEERSTRTGGQFTTRDVTTKKAKEHPLFKWRMPLLDQAEKEAGNLVGLINGCEDWTSDKYKASGIYQKMRKFVSSTSRMPGISGTFKKVRSLCLMPMEIIPGRFPDLYHPLVRKLLADEFYQIAIDDGRISPPFTWNESIAELKSFLDNNVVWQKPADYNMTEKKDGNRKWEVFDCLFRKPNGDPITAKQLRDA